jgi:hypothetical protein
MKNQPWIPRAEARDSLFVPPLAEKQCAAVLKHIFINEIKKLSNIRLKNLQIVRKMLIPPIR